MGIKGKDKRSIQGVPGASQPVRRALGQVVGTLCTRFHMASGKLLGRPVPEASKSIVSPDKEVVHDGAEPRQFTSPRQSRVSAKRVPSWVRCHCMPCGEVPTSPTVLKVKES